MSPDYARSGFVPAPFAHLHCHSPFSFGEGPSSIASLTLRAAELGQGTIALTDTMSVSGVPELVWRCQKAGLRPIGGCEIVLDDHPDNGSRLTLLADGPGGFAALCHLLSTAGLRDIRRAGARVLWGDLHTMAMAGRLDHLVCLTGAPPFGLLPRLLLARRDEEARATLDRLSTLFAPGRLFVEVVRSLVEGEHALSLYLLDLADTSGVPAVATSAVRHATKVEFPAHEALRRIALGVPIHDEHGALPLNGERYLKTGDAMAALFADRPDTIRNAVALAESLAPPLDPAVRHYPRYSPLPEGESAFGLLSGLVWAGARQRGITDFDRLIHELEVVRDLDYCDYFLICRQVVLEARARGIGCALRGSAIGSAALYALGVSSHDPIERRVSFDRFLSRARRKPPDIDIDFAHDRRDEMQGWLRETFGRERVAVVCNYVTYRGRSLLRDLGKVLDIDGPDLERLRSLLWHARGDDLAEKLESLPELQALRLDPDLYGDLFALCAQLAGNPRHLGTHSSGIVVSDVPVGEVAPVLWAAKGVPVVAFDKDDVESPGIGLLKMDQLCLRALTAVEIAASRLRESDPGFDYAARDREDPDTLAMIRAAQTIGVFQLESPAQMALQWRLKADRFDDLVHAVALIRPGPLVGGGVGPYVAVRHGLCPAFYPLPELEPILSETYGRILFQDQVLDVVRVVGSFGHDEADTWLKAMTHARNEAEMKALGLELLARAQSRGMRGKAFEKLWKQIKGFSRYGFCHGHSVAFADHAQGTAWLLRHHPAEFLAAVLSVEPCGFWPVATVVEEARRRGVCPLGPCVNRSAAREWTVEDTAIHKGAIRGSLSQVGAVTPPIADAIVAERKRAGLFTDLADAGRRLSFAPRDTMEWLTLAGAMDSLEPSRRRAIWSLPSIHRPGAGKRPARAPAVGQEAIALVIPPMLPPELPDFDDASRESHEWKAMGFSPAGHPMRRLRERLAASGVRTCAELQNCADGESVTIAGLWLHPHRPPTPSGEIVVFSTLEDETGLAQVTVPPDAYARCGATLFTESLLIVEGTAAIRGAGRILIAFDAGATLSCSVAAGKRAGDW